MSICDEVCSNVGEDGSQCQDKGLQIPIRAQFSLFFAINYQNGLNIPIEECKKIDLEQYCLQKLFSNDFFWA